MTSEECMKCLGLLSHGYPNFNSRQTKADALATIKLWEKAFESDNYTEVQRAIFELIKTQKSFAPDIATIKDCMNKIRALVEKTPSDNEYWEMAERAAENSNWFCVEEYNKLPELVRKCIGKPSVLNDMAQANPFEMENIYRKRFMERLKEYREKEEFKKRLIASDVKQLDTLSE